jgi:hypothetical protein
MNGKDKTFYTFEPKILKSIDSIPDRELSHLMYAYGVRGVGNPELHKAFEKKIGHMIERLDYASMFNVIYYLLFRDIGDKKIWERIIKTTVDNPAILPILYYKPFKTAYVYLKYRYPNDLAKSELFDDLVDKFWYAERYYNALKLEDQAYAD